MIIEKFSSKLVRLKLTIKRKIEIPPRNNIGSPLQMQNSHPVKHLLMPTSKILLGMGAEVDSQLSHTFKIVYFIKLEYKTRVCFIKLDSGLILTVYAKISTRRLAGFLKHPIVILPRLILYHIIYTKYLAYDTA